MFRQSSGFSDRPSYDADRMIKKERIPLSLLSPENKQERLNELYEYGKSKGALTYKEIMDRLMELEMDSGSSLTTETPYASSVSST